MCDVIALFFLLFRSVCPNDNQTQMALAIEFDPQLEEMTRCEYSVFDEYEARTEGGLNYLPHHLIEEQRSAIWSFVKQAGKHLLTGGSLTGMVCILHTTFIVSLHISLHLAFFFFL
jgi:hypothetical protein